MWSGWYGAGYGRGRGWGRGLSGGPWPGRGPFSHLPPWQRPGCVYGRGACWWFLNPWLRSGYGAQPATWSAAGYGPPPAWWGVPGYGQTPFGYPGYAAAPGEVSREEEERMLTEELSALEARVEEIRKRLEELKK